MTAFRKGMKVVITKQGGQGTDGQGRDYYYSSPESQGILVGSAGTIAQVRKEKILVETEYGTAHFHISELTRALSLQHRTTNTLPRHAVFTLAEQSPLFVISDRLYLPTTNEGNCSFHNGTTTIPLTSSASIPSLEALATAHHRQGIDTFTKSYLDKFIEQHTTTASTSRIIDFILNDVFPHFTSTGNNKKITHLLHEEASAPSRRQSTHKTKATTPLDPAFEKLLQNISDETYSKKETRTPTKIDRLLGYQKTLTTNDLPAAYTPRSLFATIVGGRQVAILDGTLYYLTATTDDTSPSLSFDGKRYAFVAPQPLDSVEQHYQFEFKKRLKISAIQSHTRELQQVQEIYSRDQRIKNIARRKEYREGDVGFLKDEDAYWIFLTVPVHVLRIPDDYDYDDDEGPIGRRKYYLFDKTRVGVKVWEEDEEICFETEAVTIDPYEHPFCFDENRELGSICLGDYDTSKLEKLPPGQQVARLLFDTRKTLLSGYIDGYVNPVTPLSDYTDRTITLSDVRKRKLPITNIKLIRRNS